MRRYSSSPHAATIGPMVMGRRGPIRVASAPARAENSSIRIVTGMVASPASSGVKPETYCSCSTSRKPDAASAP